MPFDIKNSPKSRAFIFSRGPEAKYVPSVYEWCKDSHSVLPFSSLSSPWWGRLEWNWPESGSWGLSTLHCVWKNLNFYPWRFWILGAKRMISLKVLLTFYLSDRVDRNVLERGCNFFTDAWISWSGPCLEDNYIMIFLLKIWGFWSVSPWCPSGITSTQLTSLWRGPIDQL